MGGWSEYLKFLAALLAIVNPVGAVPIVSRLTSTRPEAEGRRIVRLASATVILALLTTLLLGEPILHFFGITVASFRVGGGILLLLMAVAMMQGHDNEKLYGGENRGGGGTNEEEAIIPVGMPLLAGPGAISTVIIYADRHSTLGHYLALSAVIVFVGGVVWIVLRSEAAIASLLGRMGMRIVNRIMGLVMAAVAVEFISNGLKQLFPALS